MRPKFETHVATRLLEIEAWARTGCDDKQIAHNLGIGYSTFKKYKSFNMALIDALNKGKVIADLEVENALHKRAKGYEYTEVKVIQDAQGNTLRKEAVKKQIPPDVTAQIFWLKNRQPARWRDKQEHSIEGDLLIQVKHVKSEETNGTNDAD